MIGMMTNTKQPFTICAHPAPSTPPHTTHPPGPIQTYSIIIIIIILLEDPLMTKVEGLAR